MFDLALALVNECPLKRNGRYEFSENTARVDKITLLLG